MTSKFLLKCFVVCCLGNCVLAIAYTQAQEILPPGRTAANTIYVEAFGSASGYLETNYQATNYSINYDRLINSVLALRFGAAYIPAIPMTAQQINFKGSIFTFPLTASYLHNFNGSSHNAEVGLGIVTTVSWVNFDKMDLNGANFHVSDFGYTPRVNGIIGYRFQPQDGGVNIRAVFTPLTIIYWYGLGPLELFAGISVGYTF